MTSYQIIKTAQEMTTIKEEQAAEILLGMNRRDVRAIMWLITTGKLNTITPGELDEERTKEKEYRKDKL